MRWQRSQVLSSTAIGVLMVAQRGLMLFADIGQRAGLLITADLAMQPILLPGSGKPMGSGLPRISLTGQPNSGGLQVSGDDGSLLIQTDEGIHGVLRHVFHSGRQFGNLLLQRVRFNCSRAWISCCLNWRISVITARQRSLEAAAAVAAATGVSSARRIGRRQSCGPAWR